MLSTSRFSICIWLFVTVAFSTKAQKRYTLEGKKITTLELRYDHMAAAKPGMNIPLGVVANMAKGDPLLTVGSLQGKTGWENYNVHVKGGTFAAGVLTVASDPHAFENHRVMLRVVNAFDSTKSVEAQWDVNYDQDYTLDFNGKNGADGEPGFDGSPGTNAPEARSGNGRQGGNGGLGKNGRDAGHGSDGPKLTVYAWTEDDAALKAKMLHVKVVNETTGQTSEYMAYADKNKFNILANGGDGGNGGRGGNGGDGGTGGIGGVAKTSPDGKVETLAGKGGDGGNGGNGGSGGNAGNGGNGGVIDLVVDPSAKDYLNNIALSNHAGKAGVFGDNGKLGAAGQTQNGGGGKGLPGAAGVNGLKGKDGIDGKDGPKPNIAIKDVQHNR